MKRKKSIVFVLGVIIAGIVLGKCVKNEIIEKQSIAVQNTNFSSGHVEEYKVHWDEFICVRDEHLYNPVTQEKFCVVGINMDNNTWNPEITPGNRCMDETSYAEIKAIGFNTIRFGITYSMTLEDSFYEWLDENIAWAEAAGLKIILDMHAPQGGIQLRSKKDAARFWSKKSVQQEFIDMWVEIASHYRNNKCVIMYDLLNEPLVIAESEEAGEEKYVDFMQRLTQSIREVDNNHVLCIEGFSIQKQGTNVNEFSYVATASAEWQRDIEDENVIFDTHFYGPTVFTMQSEEKPLTYEDVLVIKDEASRSGTDRYTQAISEVNKWIELETDWLSMPDKTVNTGVVKVMLNKVPKNAQVDIDNIVVEEYDTQYHYLGNAYECYFDQDGYHWSQYGNGLLEVVPSGVDDVGGSLCLKATINNAEYTIKQTASSVNGMFEMNPEHYYKVKMMVKSNVKLDSNRFRLDIAGYYSGFIGGLDDYAAYTIQGYADKRTYTGRAQICNEFGCNYNSMCNGGEQYLYDVVHNFYENDINFCLFAYTGFDFGMMYDSNRDFGTDKCLLRQDSYSATYRVLNQDMTYDHIFKNIETMCAYNECQAGERILVLGEKYAGVGPKQEYIVTTKRTNDSIVLNNGLYADYLLVITE